MATLSGRPVERVALVAQPFDRLFPPGESLGVWVRAVAEQIAAAGIAVRVYHRDATRPGTTLLDGVEFRHVPDRLDGKLQRLLAGSPLWSPRRPFLLSAAAFPEYWHAVAGDLGRGPCDVVHVLNFPQGVAAVPAGAALRVLHMQCEWLNQAPTRAVRRLLRQADLIVGCSAFVTEAAAAAHPGLSCAFATVFNGTALAREPASEPVRPQLVAGLPASEYGSALRGSCARRVLYVGRIAPEKGIHVLLDAFRMVHARLPDVGLEIVGDEAKIDPFHFATSSDPQVRELLRFYEGEYSGGYLRGLLRDLPDEIRPWILLSGKIPHPDLLAQYARAEVFAFPSIWPEPFGIPVVEAMAASVPVVATTAGAFPEIVPAGTGVLVEPGNADALADALVSLLEDEQARSSHAAAARLWAERFSWQRIAAELLDLYRRQLADRGPRALVRERATAVGSRR